ncbi:MAG: 16S rRNA (cytosine(1402)-N(4))-methyltransferase RsmH [Kiloniellales bacterium]|nr:16S rRNA (cytosine(1402)-N(4))-methyltransferase RsmH [Kiloniellales bacterium]
MVAKFTPPAGLDLSGRKTETGGHTPVMLREVLEILQPRDGGIYVDGTFGAGGYTSAILEEADCRVWAIDRDPSAVAAGQALVEHYRGRLTLLEGRFGEMAQLLPKELNSKINGIALDLGVSSMQLDQAERGFSFRQDGPLDMRMDGPHADTARSSAAQIIMTMSEGDLADLIFKYGEERQSRRVAKAIIAARQEKPITGTQQLREIIHRVLRKSPGGIDPATRTFQALRIFVNDELGELERGLQATDVLLAPGGIIAVVSFHSLEDRIVKTFFKQRSGGEPAPSRHAPHSLSPCRLVGEDSSNAAFTLLFRGAKKPKEEEINTNPRARSARLRAAMRNDSIAAETGARP